jgi:hypothetical protein
MVFTLTLAVAQTPGYYLIYGNRDGADIEIEVWGVTADTTDDIDLNGDGILDSVNFMHNPLSSNDSIIVSRNGGDFYYPLDQWDHVDFLPPDSNSPIFGYTNHSLLAFADIGGDPNILFNSEGDTLLITILYMRTTSDSSYLNQEVCPFQEGFNPSHGSLGGFQPVPRQPAMGNAGWHLGDHSACNISMPVFRRLPGRGRQRLR